MNPSGLKNKLAIFIPLIIFFVSFTIYSLTAARYLVNIADSDELITAAYSNGVAHPPSYPLYSALLSSIFHIPFIHNPIAAAHLTSGIFQSAALVFFYLTAYKITRNRFISVISSFILGFSYTFWNQATYAEVFSLHILFLSVLIWLVIRNADYRIICFLMGLSLTQHQLTICVLPGIWWISRVKKHFPWFKSFLFFISGFLLPYIRLLFIDTSAPLSWKYEATIEGFFQLLNRSVYAATSSTYTISLIDHLSSLGSLLRVTITSFGPLILFSVIGLFTLKQTIQQKWGFLAIGAFLSGPVLFWQFIFLDPKRVTPEMYAYSTFLTSRISIDFQYFVSIFIAVGMCYLLKTCQKMSKRYLLIPLLGISLLLTCILVFDHFSEVNKQTYSFDEMYYREVLEQLPQNSALIVDSDDIFGLLASQVIQHYRPDVLLLPTAMQMRWGFLQRILPKETFTVEGYLALLQSLTHWSENHQMNLFVYLPRDIAIQQWQDSGYTISPYGYSFKVSKYPTNISTFSYKTLESFLPLSDKSNDMWKRFNRKQYSKMFKTMSYLYQLQGNASMYSYANNLSRRFSQ